MRTLTLSSLRRSIAVAAAAAVLPAVLHAQQTQGPGAQPGITRSEAELKQAAAEVRAGRSLVKAWPNNAKVAVCISFDIDNESPLMARELAPQGIRVNSVAPGSILFPGGGWDKRQKEHPEGIAAFVKSELPFGRFGTPEEVADVVVFLASERACWVSGACITVDGCQSRSLI